jgi:hypothetical protein
MSCCPFRVEANVIRFPGDFSRKNAEKAYHEALNYFEQLSYSGSLERWKLMDLVNQAKDAIATLPQPATH